MFGLRIFRPLDHPIWDLDSLQIPNYPRRVWTQDFQTVGSPDLRFGESPNPKLPLTCLDSGFPDRWITRFEIWIVSKPQITSDVFGLSISRPLITRFEIWIVFKPQITPDVFGLRISKPLDHPIWDLDSLQTPNYPRRVWTQDFQTVGSPNLRFG